MNLVHEPGPWTGSMGWSMDLVHRVVHGPGPCFVYVWVHVDCKEKPFHHCCNNNEHNQGKLNRKKIYKLIYKARFAYFKNYLLERALCKQKP